MWKFKIFLYSSFYLICIVLAEDIDSLIATANIYYQRPLCLGAPSELMLEDVQELTSKKDIKVIVHGYIGSRTHFSITPLGYAYLANGQDNVFVADWADAAHLDYLSSREAVTKVAKHFGGLLNDFFLKHEIDYEEVHIIGHSLGAHIAGNIGEYFNGNLGRITGLDPALPLFTPKSNDSLKATHARFVDVIHTDYPVFGALKPRGIADFYPNFGRSPQPGCPGPSLSTVIELLFDMYSCSHNRAVILYAESIGLPKSFPALPCSYSGIKTQSVDKCSEKLKEFNMTTRKLEEAISSMDEDQVVYMGEKVSRSATGSYYLPTHGQPPYGLGAETHFNN